MHCNKHAREIARRSDDLQGDGRITLAATKYPSRRIGMAVSARAISCGAIPKSARKHGISGHSYFV
jgi:hypothetical protein